jgi:hypothetical protein
LQFGHIRSGIGFSLFSHSADGEARPNFPGAERGRFAAISALNRFPLELKSLYGPRRFRREKVPCLFRFPPL